MSNFTTYFVVFILPMPRYLRAACGSPRLYASSNSRSTGPRLLRSSTLKLALDSSSSPKSAMLLARELLQERRVAALDLAGNDDDLRTRLVLVHVVDRLVQRSCRRSGSPAATSCRRRWATRSRSAAGPVASDAQIATRDAEARVGKGKSDSLLSPTIDEMRSRIRERHVHFLRGAGGGKPALRQ